MIETTRTRARLAGGDYIRAFVAQLRAQGRAVPDPSPPGDDPPVVAYVNHGRWVADCACRGAELVDPDDPLFYCLSCYNAGHGGRLRRVLFPPQAPEIAAELDRRREPVRRNWYPGETVDHLRAERVAFEGRV